MILGLVLIFKPITQNHFMLIVLYVVFVTLYYLHDTNCIIVIKIDLCINVYLALVLKHDVQNTYIIGVYC